MTTETDLAAAFDAQRHRLVALAHRMLGSPTDAEDAVQEAWLRLARQKPGTIDSLPGWLTTVVGRVCIDVLRTRRSRPETHYGEHLPDAVVTEDEDGPEERAALADSVGLALLVVLESLAPDERLAFVLHDTFGVPFAEIAQILGKSTDATKMLASRARRKVRGIPESNVDRSQQREVVDAFLAAARSGDFEALLQVLDPQITWRTYTPRGVVVKLGATEVVAAAERGVRAAGIARRVLVNGNPGILSWSRSGKPLGLMSCTVRDGKIVDVVALLDPARLATMDLPDSGAPGQD
ncbi:DNA-directed RNA polymerase sigma-70 factor [Mycolicibacterium chitae]|uniref:sigma-70 family RNA polymerase sigma factor n=1 Tax=Mycolicibacterium chitae TaxID=1792 RepID=UPI000F84E468|nr:sigma-70 family RNA polymerase sigma factor [Mycolicibacterium chitae]MCV7107116.1 sigma-70 family RNA polymerase sigma factor [Mycolicibacterium chitae]BBZ02618.1 DNA-directed RNA polymerase sigma-70 factor [Mycolicibacterium chitae]